jgi:hypothetical protein
MTAPNQSAGTHRRPAVSAQRDLTAACRLMLQLPSARALRRLLVRPKGSPSELHSATGRIERLVGLVGSCRVGRHRGRDPWPSGGSPLWSVRGETRERRWMRRSHLHLRRSLRSKRPSSLSARRAHSSTAHTSKSRPTPARTSPKTLQTTFPSPSLPPPPCQPHRARSRSKTSPSTSSPLSSNSSKRCAPRCVPVPRRSNPDPSSRVGAQASHSSVREPEAGAGQVHSMYGGGRGHQAGEQGCVQRWT